MLFVPFALQANYGAHHLTPAPGTPSLNLSNGSSISPSGVMASTTKDIKLSWSTSPGLQPKQDTSSKFIQFFQIN
ncbi:hypothetical protein PGB90_000659 [Kerria lacca]